MQTLDVSDNALRWETERQNRILREAIEQKKRKRDDEGHRSARGMASERSEDAPTLAVANVLTEEWADKLLQIPDMRSALIPLDEASEGADWSRPFSLVKADIEPWLSFLKGYYESRLFLGGLTPSQDVAAARDASQVDFAVRALLDLKHVGIGIILEPPVQINRQVEYHDLEAELRANRNPAVADMLLRSAGDMHDKLLAKAVVKGRELGDRLYDALMGEGHANLIRAWEKTHGRKPSVEDLHRMLTTGRVKAEKRQNSYVAPVLPLEQAAPERPPTARTSVEQPIVRGTLSKAVVKPVKRFDEKSESVSSEKTVPSAATATTTADIKDASRVKRILWYALHATVVSSAIVAYLWMK